MAAWARACDGTVTTRAGTLKAGDESVLARLHDLGADLTVPQSLHHVQSWMLGRWATLPVASRVEGTVTARAGTLGSVRGSVLTRLHDLGRARSSPSHPTMGCEK